MVAKTRLLESDVQLIARLLEDPEGWDEGPRKFARKILQALYENGSDASIGATRGIIVVQGGPGCVWAIGPYPTVSAARAAAEGPDVVGFSGSERRLAVHLTHPNRYYEERKDSARKGPQLREREVPQPRAA